MGDIYALLTQVRKEDLREDKRKIIKKKIKKHIQTNFESDARTKLLGLFSQDDYDALEAQLRKIQKKEKNPTSVWTWIMAAAAIFLIILLLFL